MIWKLTRKDSVGYDEYESKIVRAKSEKEARRIANKKVGDEGPLWEDPTYVSCERVLVHGPSKELLGSFNAG